MTPSPLRRIVHLFVPALLIAAMLAVLPAVTKAAPVVAAEGDYQCSDTLYGTNGTGLYKLVPGASSVTETKVGDFPANVNSVAVVPRGSDLYAMSAQSGGSATLYRFGDSAAYRTITGLSTSEFVVGGAINPQTGDYWFSTTRTDNTTMRFFKIALGTSGGSVAVTPVMTTTTPGYNGVSTDFAFDSRGNAYVEFSSTDSAYTNRLMRFTAAQLTSGGAQVGTQVTTLGSNGTAYPGIAFGSDGYIYVQGGSNLYRLRPTNGTSAATLATPRAYNDLGSCATPGVMDNVVKDVVARKKSTDQFVMSLSGPDLTTLSGTTAGTDTGLQLNASEIAGPTLVLPGATYTIAETAAGGADLADYMSTYECVNVDTAAVVASGTGTTGALTVPPANAEGVNANITCTFTNTPKAPSITLTKTATGTPAQAGDPITYAFAVQNTGNMPLSSIAVTDPLLAGKTITCAATTLAVGASTTCSVSSAYAVTQGDVNTGTVVNTATVSGTPSGMTAVTATSSTATPIARTARLKLEKSASGSPTKAGDPITYSFTVTNTGNTTVTGVGVNDPLVTGETCSPTTLAPGAVATCTSNDYTVTQGDVNAGTVNNTAAPVGSGPSGMTPTTDSTSTASTVTPLTRTSRLSIAKSAAGTPAKAGDTITYAFTVTNTGNTTVTGVGVDDPLVTGETCSPTTLAPGASANCTSNAYTVTQGDVNAGTVVNTATPTGTGPSGAATVTVDPSSTGQATTPIAAAGVLDVTLAPSPDAITAAGETITYTYTVENTGNVTVDTIAVTDSLGNTIGCDVTTLAPGESATCTATYEVTQPDVDAGTVTNRATAEGLDPSDSPVVDSAQVATTIAAAGSVAITLAQSSATVSEAGDGVLYFYTVQNTGNVTLTDVDVTDTLGNPNTCATSIAPGATVFCSSRYVVEQTDVDAGRVDNTASVTATPVRGDDVEADSDPVVKTIAAQPGLTTTLAASGTPTNKGDEITYTTTVENTGNVTIDALTVTDALGTTSVCADTELAPGDSTTCTATYAVTQADVDAGEVVNTATGAGTTPEDVAVSVASNEVETAITQTPGLSTTLLDAGTPTKQGDGITYTMTVENTGNVTVDGLLVTDALGNAYACGVTELAPGDRATCTATYAVTQADVDRGTVANSGVAEGDDPAGDPVSDASNDVDTAIPADAELTTTLVPSGSPTKQGDEITWTATVTNTGNVTVDAVTVTDVGGNVYTCDVATLAPGASATCVATDAVTQAEVNAGEVVNTATGAGTDPSDDPVTDASAEETVTIAQGAALTVVLAQSTGTVTKQGDTITYTYTVENTGNVTVDELEVTDVLGSTLTCDVDELAPGETATCTATRTVTQGDVDAGEVANTATAVGRTPTDVEVEADSNPVLTTIVAAPEMTTTLVASGTPTEKGDEVVYTVTVENTGNVTVDQLVVTDALGNTYTCDVTTLAPGEKAECTATYEVTQADVDAGEVVNSVTGSGEDPAGDAVDDDSSTVTTTIAATARLEITDATALTPVDADRDGRDSAGDTVVRTYTVENTGNVTLTGVQVTDASGAIACVPADLAPGATATCTSAPMPLTQEQLDAGRAVTHGTATATTPASATVTSADSADVVTPLAPQEQLSVTTRVASWTDVNGDGKLNAGDEVFYEFDVVNTGTVTVDGLTVRDDRLTGQGIAIGCPTPIGRLGLAASAAGIGGPTLAPGQSTTCVGAAGYVVTAADMERHLIEDSAVAEATGRHSQGPVSATSNVVASVPVASPKLTLTTDTKVEDVNHNGLTDAGDKVTFTYVVTNSGDVTLEKIAVTDPRLAEQGITITCTPSTLAPGESATCVASAPYIVTPTDVKNGAIVSEAVASGVDPVGATPVEVESDEVTSVVETETESPEPSDDPSPEPREHGALADAGGPVAAAGALGVVALGLGLGLVGAARRRREDEAA